MISRNPWVAHILKKRAQKWDITTIKYPSVSEILVHELSHTPPNLLQTNRAVLSIPTGIINPHCRSPRGIRKVFT